MWETEIHNELFIPQLFLLQVSIEIYKGTDTQAVFSCARCAILLNAQSHVCVPWWTSLITPTALSPQPPQQVGILIQHWVGPTMALKIKHLRSSSLWVCVGKYFAASTNPGWIIVRWRVCVKGCDCGCGFWQNRGGKHWTSSKASLDRGYQGHWGCSSRLCKLGINSWIWWSTWRSWVHLHGLGIS